MDRKKIIRPGQPIVLLIIQNTAGNLRCTSLTELEKNKKGNLSWVPQRQPLTTVNIICDPLLRTRTAGRW
jgi:hypothetical protein